MNVLRKTLLATAAAAVLATGVVACATAATAPAGAPAAAMAAATASVGDSRRPAADTARDPLRKPAETVVFAGVRPGSKVAELGPGGGYYTRVLAGAVGPTGKVYAVVSPAQAQRPGGLDALNAIAQAYGNVVVVTTPNNELKLPEPVDVVWTTENYHDFHNGPTADVPGINRAVFAALKPGGIFFVEDHSAAPGAGLAAASSLHRMDEDLAKSELTAAGFRLDAESNHLRHPEDNKTGRNAEAGPSTSDRFALRMKKPG